MLMKIDGFVLLPMMGFSTAVTTYVGQNVGAGDLDRTNKGVRTTLLVTCGVTLVLSVILYFFCPAITLIFGSSENARFMAAQGIRFVCFFYFFYGVQNILAGTLRGAGAALSASLCVICSTILKVPITWALTARPLDRDLEEAVAAGTFLSREAAAAAGVGMDHYIGVFQAWGISMLMGMLIIPLFFFGHWREKGITDKAKQLKR
jgi:Na+-driven multidrug efflux pump